MKKIWMILLMLGVVSVSACNTIEGAGKDVEATGDAIKDEAREHK